MDQSLAATIRVNHTACEQCRGPTRSRSRSGGSRGSIKRNISSVEKEKVEKKPGIVPEADEKKDEIRLKKPQQPSYPSPVHLLSSLCQYGTSSTKSSSTKGVLLYEDELLAALDRTSRARRLPAYETMEWHFGRLDPQGKAARHYSEMKFMVDTDGVPLNPPMVQVRIHSQDQWPFDTVFSYHTVSHDLLIVPRKHCAARSDYFTNRRIVTFSLRPEFDQIEVSTLSDLLDAVQIFPVEEDGCRTFYLRLEAD